MTSLCRIFYFLLFVSQSIVIWSQTSISNEELGIKKELFVPWGENGFPYSKVPGANLGVSSFQIINNNAIAFLSTSSNEVLLINKKNEAINSKFLIEPAPRDFIYDHDFFYILFDNKIAVYDSLGNKSHSINLPSECEGADKIFKYGSKLYVLLGNGNSVEVVEDGNNFLFKYYKGWITSSGAYVSTNKSGDNFIEIQVSLNGNNYSKHFEISSDDVAGVFLIGADENKIILDVQYYPTQNPLEITRKLVYVKMDENGIGDIIYENHVPDCYYVLTVKPFVLDDNGKLYTMITSPSGMYLFSINKYNEGSKDFPSELKNLKYHYNNHLLQSK